MSNSKKSIGMGVAAGLATNIATTPEGEIANSPLGKLFQFIVNIITQLFNSIQNLVTNFQIFSIIMSQKIAVVLIVVIIAILATTSATAMMNSEDVGIDISSLTPQPSVINGTIQGENYSSNYVESNGYTLGADSTSNTVSKITDSSDAFIDKSSIENNNSAEMTQLQNADYGHLEDEQFGPYTAKVGKTTVEPHTANGADNPDSISNPVKINHNSNIDNNSVDNYSIIASNADFGSSDTGSSSNGHTISSSDYETYFETGVVEVGALTVVSSVDEESFEEPKYPDIQVDDANPKTGTVFSSGPSSSGYIGKSSNYEINFGPGVVDVGELTVVRSSDTVNNARSENLQLVPVTRSIDGDIGELLLLKDKKENTVTVSSTWQSGHGFRTGSLNQINVADVVFAAAHNAAIDVGVADEGSYDIINGDYNGIEHANALAASKAAIKDLNPDYDSVYNVAYNAAKSSYSSSFGFLSYESSYESSYGTGVVEVGELTIATSADSAGYFGYGSNPTAAPESPIGSIALVASMLSVVAIIGMRAKQKAMI